MTEAGINTERDKRRGTLALIFSAISLIVASAAAYLSYSALHEQREVRLEGFASASALGDSKAGFGIRITLANEGLRSLIIHSAHLVADDTVIAEADTYTPDFGFLNIPSLDDPGLDAQPLPITVNARSVRTIAAFFNLSDAADGAAGDRTSPIFRSAYSFCRAIQNNPVFDGMFSLRVSAKPGGIHEFPVRFAGVNYGIPQWTFIVRGRARAPDGISVWLRNSRSLVRLVTLQIWTLRRGLIQSVTRPIYGSTPAPIPLRNALGRGKYRVVLLERGKAVSGGVFHVPLHPIYDRNVLRPLYRQSRESQCSPFTE